MAPPAAWWDTADTATIRAYVNYLWADAAKRIAAHKALAAHVIEKCQ